MTRTLLCLARHGETNWNLERRFQGQLDIPLNYKGRLQAEALDLELAGQHFDRIYASDLSRAVETAAPHAERRELSIVQRPELREKNDGLWHGLSHDEVAARYPGDYLHYLERRADYAPEGGETLMRFAARVRTAVTKIAAAHPGETLLVVVHAGVLDIVWRMATGRRLDEPRNSPALNAAPNWFAFEDGEWSLVDWAKAENRTAVIAPYEGRELARREASRLLLVNGKNETLLLKFSSSILPNVAEQGFDHFWGQPGGQREDGESFEDCALREMREETGFEPAEVGAPIAQREFPLRLPSGWVQGVERYFLLRCDEFAPNGKGLTDQEASYVLGWKWWAKDEIAASREPIFPEGLAYMLTMARVG
jgi:probable phosphoglycerate mutase